MHHAIWVLGILLLLIGCSSKEEKALIMKYQEKLSYHQKLQKTEKLQLYNSENVTQLLIMATYITKKDREIESKKDERFIISISAEEDTLSLKRNNYHLVLNNKEPKSIKPLNDNDALLKDISFLSQWKRYYLVTFNHIDSKKLTLSIESKLYGKGELHFAKVAKYLLKKENL
ncbi:MAG: hypothetical protein U9O24_10630 [Campylobacterota bacterium]|nr:hypothetical protein [Campylobacterota bacterium]